MVKLDPIEAEPPLRFGQQAQLLVDNEVLCDWWNLRRVQEKVQKHPQNPIIEADQPWEQAAANTYGTFPNSVIYDVEDRLFKLWYSIYVMGSGSTIAYATSEDGINWTKPDLSLVAYAGTEHNNVCRLEPMGKPVRAKLQLVGDPRSDDPDQRFKAVGVAPYHADGSIYGGWVGIAFSVDGTTWRLVEGGVREGRGGGHESCVWDERLKRYVMFQRQLMERADPHLGTTGRYATRQESEDLINWSARQTVFNPHMNSNWPEVESMMVFRHEGIYFALAYMLNELTRGELESHLLTSRDGLRWEHPFPDEAFVPRGGRGSFDDMRLHALAPVIHGDAMRFYYGGAQMPHGNPLLPIVDDGGSLNPEVHRPYRVGLATVPLDRLIGLRADEPVGTFLTRPFIADGEELYINANVDSELRVEVVNPRTLLGDIGKKGHLGHYITGIEELYPGFEHDKCPAITGDRLRHHVRWEGGSIGKFKGRAVRLRFLARMATIYSFQIR